MAVRLWSAILLAHYVRCITATSGWQGQYNGGATAALHHSEASEVGAHPHAALHDEDQEKEGGSSSEEGPDKAKSVYDDDDNSNPHHHQHRQASEHGQPSPSTMPDARSTFPASTGGANIYMQWHSHSGKHYLKACGDGDVASVREPTGWCEHFYFDSQGGGAYGVYTHKRKAATGTTRHYLSVCNDGEVTSKIASDTWCEHFYFEALNDGSFAMYTQKNDTRFYVGVSHAGEVITNATYNGPAFRLHLDVQETSGYVGCFVHEHAARMGGRRIKHKSLDMCRAIAIDRGKAFFGLEDPESSAVSGQATCFVMDHMPHLKRAADAECEAQDMLDGRRIGGQQRLAVYRVQDWVRIVHCDGTSSTDRLDMTAQTIRRMARVATRVKICTRGDGADCVVSEPHSPPIEMLRHGWLLNHRLAGGENGCDDACVVANWREVGSHRLSSLRSNCTPTGDHAGALDGTTKLFDACGNHEGLQISVADGGECTWGDSATGDALEVFIDAEYQPIWMDLSSMLTSASSVDSNAPSERAVDGNPNPDFNQGSCTQTKVEANPWWSVNFGNSIEVVAVKVTNRGDCCGDRLDPFYISIDGQYCAEEHIKAGETKQVRCEAIGRELKISTMKRDHLNLCEVQVQGFVPVWLNLKDKKLAMSSVENNGFKEKAVDGDSTPDYRKGGCTHTQKEQSPWWEVDLGRRTAVVAVKVTNRADCCGSRLNPFVIAVDGHECARSPIQGGQTMEVACGRSGRVVRISSEKHTSLTLCEVGIKGIDDPRHAVGSIRQGQRCLGVTNWDVTLHPCEFNDSTLDEQWTMPLAGVPGTIGRVGDPGVCMDMTGATRDAGKLQMWTCNTSGIQISHFHWVTPVTGEGPIRWAAQPDQCIDATSGVPELRACEWEASGKPTSSQLWTLPAAASVCRPGSWFLTLSVTGACDLHDSHGHSLCSERGQRRALANTLVAGDSCQNYHVEVVESCGDKDAKCFQKNCGMSGVVRIANAEGVFARANTEDGMLTCGDSKVEIVAAEFAGERRPKEQDEMGYVGCFMHIKEVASVQLHAQGIDARGCRAAAWRQDSRYFGLENPEGMKAPRRAECYFMSGLPDMLRTNDLNCAIGGTDSGYHLGGSEYLAIYRTEAANPLSNDNGGCDKLDTQERCEASKDGRVGEDFSDSPCQWCCGRACTSNSTARCQPQHWLFRQDDYIGMSSNGLGESSCEEWVRIAHCEGKSSRDRLDFAPLMIIAMAHSATQVRICTAGTQQDCVTSRPNRFPIQMLRRGFTSSYTATAVCNRSCIEEAWQQGSEGRFPNLWSNCSSRARSVEGETMLYDACGNPNGLHMSIEDGGQCGWTEHGNDSIEVFIDAQVDYVLTEHGRGCGAAAIVDLQVCQAAAQSLGFNSSTVEEGAWQLGPPGCFVGHPDDGWQHTYFNLVAGSLDSERYRSICLKGHLSSDNDGCSTLTTEARCVGARDGKEHGHHKGSPCRWCCGEACTPLSDDKCAPESWLLKQKTYTGRSRSFAGDDSCEAVAESPTVLTCKHGTVPQTSCLAAARKLVPTNEIQGRMELQVVNGTGKQLSGLGGVPRGCSLLSGGDWAAFYNIGEGINNGLYSPVCEEACEKQIVNPPEEQRKYSRSGNPGNQTTSMLDSTPVWTPPHDAVGEWVEIELSELRIVNGLVTQGGAQTEGDCHSAERVTRYTVQYREGLAGPWKHVQGRFDAGCGDGLVQVDFPQPVAARMLKVVVEEWAHHIALRVGVVVCSEPQPPGEEGLAWMTLSGHYAYQSSTVGNAEASRAVDGITDTDFSDLSCTLTGSDENDPWWAVDLGAKYEISKVKVTNRADESGAALSPFYILVDGEHCATGRLGLGETKAFECRATGSSVKIELRRMAALSLCEVQIEAHRLMSGNEDGSWISLRGHTATQQTTGQGGVAEKAVDGRSDGDFSQGSCTFTGGQGFAAWWEVELGNRFDLQAVKVTNRNDCCGEQLYPFHVKVDGIICGTATQKDEKDGVVVVNCEATGSKLRIEQGYVGGILTLCEVEVKGFERAGFEQEGGILIPHCICDGCGDEEDGRIALDTSVPYDDIDVCIDRCKNNPSCKRMMLYRGGGCALFNRGARQLSQSSDKEQTSTCWISHEACMNSFTETCEQGAGRCTNRPAPEMLEKGLTCETWDWMYLNRCNAPASINPDRDAWVEHKYCQQSCWDNHNKYDGDDCSEDTLGFVACFVTMDEIPGVTSSHEDTTIKKCRGLASSEEKLYFGMAEPGLSLVAGQARCLLLESLPPLQRAPESECSAEGLVHGYHLGGSHRLAVYETQAAGKGLPLDGLNKGCRTLQTEDLCVASRDGTTGHSYSGSPCQWCCGEACTSPTGNLCEPSAWLFGQSNYVGHGKSGLGEDTCQVCGATAAAKNFSTKARMHAAGWHFDWQDPFTFRPAKDDIDEGLVHQVSEHSYYGFKKPGSGSLSLELQGEGIVILDFGNAGEGGIVTASVGKRGTSIAGASILSRIHKWAFHDKDVLRIKEEHGIIVINSIAFDCKQSSIGGFRNMSINHGPGSCADEQGRPYDSWYGTSFTYETCEAECRMLRDCLGFDFAAAPGDTESHGAVGHCELRFSHGLTPMENPGAFQARWTEGEGTGQISGVIPPIQSESGSDETRHCFRKEQAQGRGYDTCTDHPDADMRAQNLTCDMWDWMYSHRCNSPISVNPYRDGWVASRVCQRSCWEHGNGYDGDDCSKEFASASNKLAAFPNFSSVGHGLCVDAERMTTPWLSTLEVNASECRTACGSRMDCLAYSFQPVITNCTLWVSQYMVSARVQGIEFRGHQGSSNGPITAGDGREPWTCFVKDADNSSAVARLWMTASEVA